MRGMAFWETVRGVRLADVLTSQLPKLSSKMDILIQMILEMKRPENQVSEYIESENLQEHIREKIEAWHNLVSIIYGRNSADKVLVIFKK